MKTLSSVFTLVLIAAVCTFSAILYLNEQYNISALLTMSWIVSITLWIRSNGLLHSKNQQSNQ